ncbi:putative pre-mRNA splicing factor [Gorgonomyces haynaldii]|nr:putative pre-mRNA splicing factor [Gorgonomyces haynaldii]
MDIKGLIIPPPEIRKIVDKTADYVARNGPEFEERIREQQEDNPKFGFMNPNDPYYGYFQHMVTEYKLGKTQKKEEEVTPVVVEKKQGPPKPNNFEFLGEFPSMSKQDLEILKLTAQYVARNGREFLQLLAQRENRNPQFEFVRPSHSLYNYFTKLVDQYTKIMLKQANIMQQLGDNITDRVKVIDRIMQRVNYEAYIESEQQRQKKEMDEEKLAFATIDWHDFIVVETIQFTQADDATALPPPMSVIEIQSMSLEQRKNLLVFDQVEEAQDMEVEDTPMPFAPPVQEEQKPVERERVLDAKIRTDYVPKLGKQIAEQTTICPRCSQAIKTSEMSQHMKICLLDPQAREQQARFEAKNRYSNLADTNQMEQQLSKLKDMRTDVFGGEHTLEEKIQEQKKLAQSKVIWDGQKGTATKAQIQMNRLAAKQAEELQKESELEQEAKRIKLDPNQVLIQVILPSKETINVGVEKQSSVSELKKAIFTKTSMAVSKQKLTMEDGTVLKNATPMATIVSGTVVTLESKERGGKKQ